MTNQRDDTCRCGGPGVPVGNRPLFELRNLIASLERQHAEKTRTTVKRIIGEIERHLAFPVRDAADEWERQERRSLGELLEMLKAA